jgi:biotin carboxylase
MKKKLAIICASAGQIPMVNRAKEMGIETHCFAWDKGHYSVCKGIADYFHPISILEKEQILEVCKDLKIDGITSVADANAAPTIAFVAENMRLIGNKYEDIVITCNKFLARQILSKNGVNSPRFAVVKEGQIPDLTQFKYPVVVKPTDRSGSQGVTNANNEKELLDAINRAQQMSFAKEALIEEFISGSEVCAHSYSWNGEHYIFAVRDKVTTGAPYFVEIAHHFPSRHSSEIIARLEAEVRKSLDALNIKFGACESEFMITENGEVYAIEVNSAWGGKDYDVIKYAYGIDYMTMDINAAMGHFDVSVVKPKYYAGTYFLSKDTEWVKKVIENKNNDPEIVEAEITKDELYPLKSNLDKSGYFIYKSDKKRTWEGY